MVKTETIALSKTTKVSPGVLVSFDYWKKDDFSVQPRTIIVDSCENDKIIGFDPMRHGELRVFRIDQIDGPIYLYGKLDTEAVIELEF